MIAVRRLLLLAVLGVLALALSGVAEARIDRPAVTPRGLTAFLLRADEPAKHEFDRTPSFAWLPVRGAIRYEFELATSKSFGEGSIVWSNANDEFVEPTTTTTTAPATTTPTVETAAAKLAKLYANLRTPTVSIDLALPWITGSPYALYAHVRAITSKGATSWSTPYGFNIRWATVPKDVESPHPGLVTWSPVAGATAYQVWLFGAKSTFMTTSNAADARDLYTFHRTNPFFTGSIKYRVRAQRALYGEVVSGLPATTWGPWSPVYTEVQPPLSLGTLGDVAAISDVQSNSAAGRAHALTPGFVFSGDSGGPMDVTNGAPAELFRVYVATDEDCVNIVYRGAIVGSPAYVPRTSGPLELPSDTDELNKARGTTLPHGEEGETVSVDGSESTTNEQGVPATTGSTAAPGSTATPAVPAAPAAAKVDLPDTAWPAGSYYWTVVPVIWEPKPASKAALPGGSVDLQYRDTELPQDACQAGRVMRFGKTTPPVVTSSRRPFASGLSPKGRLISAAHTTPSFYGTPLVAWESVLGAQEYEIQWSKSANPWRPLGSLVTGATSSLLPLEPGTWYYRVRGYNHSLLKRPQMTWSTPTALKVSKPTFSVVKGGR